MINVISYEMGAKPNKHTLAPNETYYNAKDGKYYTIGKFGELIEIGSGGAVDDMFHENAQVVAASYTLAAGRNAMSAGPITINTGVTVTIESGATWTIV